MVAILFFVGLILGFSGCLTYYFVFIRPKLTAITENNDGLRKEREALQNDIYNLNIEFETLSPQVEFQRATFKNLEEDITKKQAQQEALRTSLETVKVQAAAAADAIYEKNFSLMESAFEKSAEQLGEKYRQGQDNYQQEYLNALSDFASSFTAEVQEKKEQIAMAEALLNGLREKTWAAVAANQRALEIQAQADYYKLNLSADDIEEIKKLRNVIPYLKDKEPLNKVIWKVYYEKPYTDLVGRVVGTEARAGIYKITNLTNQMCYVGQSVDIAQRWKQHIKRGLGAETPTRNKLYPAMEQFGVENFSFEIVEECDRTLLDAREDFWQDFFKAKEFGYSIK